MFKYICHVFSLTAFCAVFNLIISSPCASHLLQILWHIWHARGTGSWKTFPEHMGGRDPCSSAGINMIGNEKHNRDSNLAMGIHSHVTPSLWQVEMWECFSSWDHYTAREGARGQQESQAVLRKHPVFKSSGTLKTSHSIFQSLKDLSFSSSP